MGIVMTGFCHPGGILQLFHRHDQQILRLPTAAGVRSLQQDPSTSDRLHHQRAYNFHRAGEIAVRVSVGFIIVMVSALKAVPIYAP
jgi:hypothetical protein